MAGFEGFSPETVDFLWGIRMNNNRDWFLEHKKNYVNYLYEPMKALGKELYEPYSRIPNLQMKVSRIYRDARMHHPEPYKESLWLCMRQEVEWWGENPCLYLEINPERVHYGFFFWRPRVEAMERFRRELEANPEPFLSLVAQAEQKMGRPITANLYKRPKPCSDPRLEKFFAWRDQIGCVVEVPVGPDMFGPQLAKRAGEVFEALYPVFSFFTRYGA